MKKLQRLTYYFLLMIATLVSMSEAQAQTVRLGINVPYPPFEDRQANGQLVGFDIDLGNALCKEAQVDCHWIDSSWDSLIPSLMARKIDAIMSTMTITAARQQQVLFSTPYLRIASAWFTTQTLAKQPFDSDHLTQQIIGVQRGTLQDAYVSEKFANNNVIRRYASLEDIVMDLQANRLTLALTDYPTGLATFIKAHPKVFAQVGPLVSDEKYFGGGAAIAFRKRDQSLANQFNQALVRLKQQGIYQQLVKQYFGQMLASQ